MTDWNKLKVLDLKAELKKRGLAQTGLKPALVARLTAAENDDGAESEATVQGSGIEADANSAASPDTISPVQDHSEVAAESFPDAPLAPATQPFAKVTNDVTSSSNHLPDAPVEEKQPEPVSAPITSTIEASQPTAQVDGHESALPSVEPQEAMEDRQKRKRRSQSPPPTAADSVRKRLRPDIEATADDEQVITSKGDAIWVEKHNAVDPGEVNAAAEEVAPAGTGVEPGPTIVDTAMEGVEIEGVEVESVPTEEASLAESHKMEVESKQVLEGTITTSEPFDDSLNRSRSRYGNLFTSSEKPQSVSMAPSYDSGLDVMDSQPDRSIAPATHPATPALYIRDFMRPLNPAQLKSYLATLAAPPGGEADLDTIIDFFLDPVRTHAFISFTTVSAASRVRSALHDRIWPEERTRKPLWVEFIPLEKVDEWIAEEQAANTGGRSGGKKWEVVYDIDEDRHVNATLQEASSASGAQHNRKPSLIVQSPPVLTPTRGIEGAPSGPRGPPNQPQRAAGSFQTLNQLFKSTTTKPILYYQPVPKVLAEKRLDHIDDAKSKEAAAGRRIEGEINRYSFEDGDVFVDRGPEIFPGIRPPPGHRAPRGGGSRGAFHGRGGFSGGFAGRPERGYDSYRGGRSGPEVDRRGSRDDRRNPRDDWRGSRDDRRGSRDDRRY